MKAPFGAQERRRSLAKWWFMAPSIELEGHIRFGPFDLSPQTGELKKDGRTQKIQPQPSRILSFLAANSGRLVTREELIEHVWGKETFVDFEHGLNFCIKQIRSALGDSAQSPIYIETLPRRGYRFIAPVQILEPARLNG